jgi:radical SAM protein with 4Fe4S-binding SPASM domain
MKGRNIKVNMNTNGLLVTEESAKRLIDLKIDCIFVSIDAMTPETLQKARGTGKIGEINRVVFNLLEARENRLYPRIGVSFTVEENNMHEKEEFIAHWIQHVDAVRVNELYGKESNNDSKAPSMDRRSCPILYDTMLIHNNGDVPLCCIDGNGETKVGNVFEQGIKGVWLGEEFQKMRYYHETKQADRIPFCKTCTDWPRYEFTKEEIVNNVLIRHSPLLTYYKRLDRLDTWKFGEGNSIHLTVNK